jgi:hypothetical protein
VAVDDVESPRNPATVLVTDWCGGDAPNCSIVDLTPTLLDGEAAG